MTNKDQAYRNTTIILIGLLIVGLLFSPIIINLAILLLVILPFLNQKPKDIFRKVIQNRLSILFIILYLILLLSYFISEEKEFYVKDIVLKLPFLFFPIIVTNKYIFQKEVREKVLIIFNFMVFVVAALSFVNFVANSEKINEQILESKAVPIVSGINHIYFSIILSFSILTSCYAVFRKWYEKFYKTINYIFSISNLVFLHVIAGKTGLAGFYVAIIVFLFVWSFKEKKFMMAIAFIILTGIIGFLAIRFIKPLNNRFELAKKDIGLYLDGENFNHYSISMRFEYWEKSFQVFLKHPLFGVGKSDVKHEMKKIFVQENSILEEINMKGPHNQYTQILAGHGLVGFFVFALILAILIKSVVKENNELMLLFLSVILFSFIFESVMERQVGLVFFVFFSFFLSIDSNVTTLTHNKV